MHKDDQEDSVMYPPYPYPPHPGYNPYYGHYGHGLGPYGHPGFDPRYSHPYPYYAHGMYPGDLRDPAYYSAAYRWGSPARKTRKSIAYDPMSGTVLKKKEWRVSTGTNVKKD